MEHRRTFAILTIVLALLGLALGACGPQGGGLVDQPYRSEQGGFTIRYPEGWTYEEQPGQVLFHDSKETKGTASVVVVVMTIPIPPEVVGAMNAKGVLELAAEGAAADFEMGSISELTVGGKEAAAADITGVEAGEAMTGRMVLVLSEQPVMIMGAGKTDAWNGFASTFDAMVESMTFFE